MKLLQEAERLLELAHADQDACIILSHHKELPPHIICFHAQQSIEKALKAILILHKQPLRRTHDLSECAYQLEELKIDLPVSIETLALLTPYAVIGRYGGIHDEIINIEEAIELMNIILEWSSEQFNNLQG
ncbi:MAG: HEPN domain-containing protein [Methanospirillaceae archaeon]|nr:HEPN domain-containing protein [Methanospirillaceae archaeon]